MQIAVVGSGRMGAALGRIWARCGHRVTFAFSRSEKKLQTLASEVGGSFGTVAEAVKAADVVLLAVHWSCVEQALCDAGDLAGKIVVSCCVPLDAADEHLLVGTVTSGAEELAKRFPAARWVATFNTSPSESLPVVYERREQSPRPQLFLCGEDAAAKRVAETLIRDVGFEPLDLGGLINARYVEPFAMITEVLAYDQPGGPALTYRFEKTEI
ncbi:NAD(P)-binding domain-containing protein [Breoghania sp.]|uniref:NADPH-dependent F420 reductase n=1 Tax=Breoghania sp. TaxID=2065378 RepID=UPI002AA76D4B|nr:NAD(P)-binding domain-containing protein [Breoghania sp.]